MDSIKRTRVHLQEIVMSSIIPGVFMHRFRDADMFICAASLKALSRMTLQRPDLFMMDKYLKYFGWMTSNKAACVRVASLAGLCAPFEALKESTKSRKSSIDIRAMENVVRKFLPRIANCVVDVNLSVQEHAMSLVLSLLREGIFDEVENDNIWIQINLQALEPNTTPRVRRDALYFVMDQLKAFDDDVDPKTVQKCDRSIDKSASLAQSSELMIVQRLDALASWYV
jgi:cohesin complex subunit SA-1/2